MNKIFISTLKAFPNEDFVSDILIPINAKKVNGILVNAYDRETGLIIKSEKEKTYYSPVSLSSFLEDKGNVINYLAIDFEKLSIEGASEIDMLSARNQFVFDVLDLYNQEVIEKNNYIYSTQFLTEKKTNFKNQVIQFTNDGLTIDKYYDKLRYKNSSTSLSDWIFKEGEAIGMSIYEPQDLIEWYHKFESKYASSSDCFTYGVSEIYSKDSFFSNTSNFEQGLYLDAKIAWSDKFGVYVENAFKRVCESYGRPEKWGYPVVGSVLKWDIDSFAIAKKALEIYYNQHLKVFIKNDSLLFDWNKSTVGTMSICFNSGRDIVISDMPIELNNNIINIHHNKININQKEQVNSFIRLVYKDLGKATYPFDVKTYLFYEI